MALNLHLLRVFAAVAACGSFSRAAKALYISQPAISKAVQEFERQLNTPLLDRSRRGVLLTEAGQVLFAYAEQIFAVERAAERALGDLHAVARGRLAIGASSTIGIYLLPTLLGAFRRRYPAIELFLDIGNTQQIVERLHTLPLDVAFVEGPVVSPDLVVTRWREDTLVVIAAADHALVEQQPIGCARLCAEPLVMREPGSGTREVVETALRAQHIDWPVAMELGSTEAVKQAVAAGLGVAVVSVATIAQELALGRLAVLDVPELQIGRTLSLLRVSGRPASRALQAFDLLCAELAVQG